MKKISAAAVGTLALLCADLAGAQNLLTNPDFDAGVLPWAAESQASVVHNASEGSPSPGSAEVTNSSTGAGNGTGINQCGGAVTAGNFFDYGGRVFIPSGQSTTGDAQVGLRWLAGANCTGATVGNQPRLQTATLDTWVSLTGFNEQAPIGAASVLFLAFPSKVEAGGTLVARFDRLYVGPPGTTPVVLSGFSVD